MSLVDDFRAAHTRIEQGLATAEAAVDPSVLLTTLRAMRDDVLSHFKAKDDFYPALHDQCLKANDAAAAQLTKIFESNMKVQSAAVQRFFSTLETSATVSSAFKTVTTVIRQRFGTEERAIFPIYLRTRRPETP